jgi:archaellum component FlaC
MEALLEEVKELASQNEDLSNSKDADLSAIRELEDQVADYRKKYERAKTELRGLKGDATIPRDTRLLTGVTSNVTIVLAEAQD